VWLKTKKSARCTLKLMAISLPENKKTAITTGTLIRQLIVSVMVNNVFLTVLPCQFMLSASKTLSLKQ